MGRYLHNFENFEEFYNSYYSKDGYSVTAITIGGTTYQYSGLNQNNYFAWVNPENDSDWVDSDVKRHPSVGDTSYILGDERTTISEVFRVPINEYYIEPWVSVVEEGVEAVYNDSFCIADESTPGCPSFCGADLL